MLATLAVGCGNGGGDGDGKADKRPADRPERSDRRAKLPHGWKRVVNRPAGFNLGVPPGWRARRGDGPTFVRSFDRALGVSVAADRSRDGRNLGPKAYARRAARALKGYRGLRVHKSKRVRGSRYLAANVQAEGVFERTRLRQDIEVFAVRKSKTATFTVIVFRSARVNAHRYAAVVKAIVRSLRSQRPVKSPQPGEPKRSGRPG